MHLAPLLKLSIQQCLERYVPSLVLLSVSCVAEKCVPIDRRDRMNVVMVYSPQKLYISLQWATSIDISISSMRQQAAQMHPSCSCGTRPEPMQQEILTCYRSIIQKIEI